MTELQRKARQRAVAFFDQTRMLSKHVAGYERAMGLLSSELETR